ncbi:MAG: hypothetical protein HN509_13320 [Halobacteriovoraceae bacterium]|jgi:cytosine/adenosine deaminase-related metal-dependent hydrolase|nr:hypothetical protein [Halobacteriovoraceae bacterium]MBT5095947.1 hypothetical protein [Halobacteriovoraceae bacterium]
MKFLAFSFFTLLAALIGEVWAASESSVVIGNIPARYLTRTQNKANTLYKLGYIEIQNRIITKIGSIGSKSTFDSLKSSYKKKGFKVYLARQGSTAYSATEYDFLYPGLIDLHNHTKQNVLGVWGLAKGQFENRFEWRKWSKYKYSVSGNMNPWIAYGKPIVCAAFRWSELQAMTHGTTYLQGPSSCIRDFSIHQVEDKGAYITKRAKIQGPTDLVLPSEMTFVWDELKPIIEKGKSYEYALAEVVNRHCDIEGISEATVNTKAGLKLLKNQKLLKAKCTKGTLHKKFVRYVYWIHGTIAGRKNYLAGANHAAIIAHLAEGRRFDKYNMVEFELVKLLGLDQPYVNFVHGVGIKTEDLPHMAKKGMGLIWSPYSNLLLYGQTLDVAAAIKAGVNLSIGTDWLPTGSRGMLDEIKIALDYVEKDPEKKNLKELFTFGSKYSSHYEGLYNLMTQNPAQMIHHYENTSGEAGVGRIHKGSMGTIIAIKKHVEDPYENIVKHGYEKDLNLVIVDGKGVYGDESYFNRVGVTEENYEKLPNYLKGFNELANSDSVPALDPVGATKASKYEHLIKMGKFASAHDVKQNNNCDVKNKVFLHQDTVSKDKDLLPFMEQTGLNLDRVNDIYRLMAVGMLTQSRNRNNKKKGKKDYRVLEFDSLFGCHTTGYQKRIFDFVNPDGGGEYDQNRAGRDELREKQNHGRTPAAMAKDYSL